MTNKKNKKRNKKRNKKKDKDIIYIFGKKISSDNFVALILCFIVGIAIICTTIYRNKKLSTNTTIVVAEITDIYKKRTGRGYRMWRYQIKYQFYLNDTIYTGGFGLFKNERGMVNIGDCIEVLVSLDNIRVQEWNKEKGSFKCP